MVSDTLTDLWSQLDEPGEPWHWLRHIHDELMMQGDVRAEAIAYCIEHQKEPHNDGGWIAFINKPAMSYRPHPECAAVKKKFGDNIGGYTRAAAYRTFTERWAELRARGIDPRT